jgi:hypothetical protein
LGLLGGPPHGWIVAQLRGDPLKDQSRLLVGKVGAAQPLDLGHH